MTAVGDAQRDSRTRRRPPRVVLFWVIGERAVFAVVPIFAEVAGAEHTSQAIRCAQVESPVHPGCFKGNVVVDQSPLCHARRITFDHRPVSVRLKESRINSDAHSATGVAPERLKMAAVQRAVLRLEREGAR